MIDRKQSPLENCKMMLREVDSMLKLVNSKSATNKTRYVQREINQEFTKAIKILSHRVLYSKDAKVSYESNRLKFATPIKLGPGQYNHNKAIEPIKTYSSLTLKNFDYKTGPKIKPCFTSIRTPTKSPKEHNLIVKQRLLKKMEMHQINNIRKRDRFKTQTMPPDEKKINLFDFIKAFFPLAVVYAANLSIITNITKQKVKLIQTLRENTKFYLSLLYLYSKIMGKLKLKLKKIRKKIATKVFFN